MDPDRLSAYAAVLALVVTVVIAVFSLREQRGLTERGLAEQIKLAHEERTWDTRADLYVDLLVWLDTRSQRIEELERAIQQQRHRASQQQIEDLIQDALAALSPAEGSESTGPDRATAPSSYDPGQAGVVAMWQLLEPPAALRERLLLFGSTDIRAAFERYRAERALPIIAGDDVGMWVQALKTSREAYPALRDAIISEVHTLTGIEEPRNSRQIRRPPRSIEHDYPSKSSAFDRVHRFRDVSANLTAYRLITLAGRPQPRRSKRQKPGHAAVRAGPATMPRSVRHSAASDVTMIRLWVATWL